MCLAGGVALNCVVNGILIREKIFKKYLGTKRRWRCRWGIGCALSAWFLHYKKDLKLIVNRDAMKGSYLGPKFSDAEIKTELDACGAVYKKLSTSDLIDTVAMALSDEKAVGWMQGRMEFGPRALGGRSIIADPRSKLMQKQLNLKVKYRETSVLSEHVSEWFELEEDSPYMLIVADLKKDKRIAMTKEEENLLELKS